VVTIVEFSDFLCVFCRRNAEMLSGLLARRSGQLRLVHRHFPLDTTCNDGVIRTMHPFACHAAAAVECAGEQGRYEREGPQHEVTITHGFWLGETPCTQALWEAVTGDNPSRFKSAERPVEQVSWRDVETFVTRLNGDITLDGDEVFSVEFNPPQSPRLLGHISEVDIMH